MHHTTLNKQVNPCITTSFTMQQVQYASLLAPYEATAFKRVAIFAKACLGASQPQQAAKTTRPFNASGGPDSPSSPALAPKRLKS
ncbi:hypothetical protein [Methylomonas sp. AM2-LC]|uniref:hypothetical protein n=1 Tax=Methylomonas sp. AM2-LC TaxID=3153301 RepID=UPI003267714A